MAQFFVEPIFGGRTAELVRLTTVGCALNSLSLVPTAVLNRRLEFRRLSLNDLINTVVRTVTSVTLAAIGWQAVGIMVGGIIGSLCGTLQLWVYSRPPRPRFHREETRALGAYGTPAAMAAISWVGFRNCDYVIVGARLGARAAGYYFRAYTLGVEYQTKFAVVLNVVGFPLLARTNPGDDQRQLRRRMVQLLTVVVFPALGLLAVESPVLIPWLFGAAWRPVVEPTQFLVIGGAVTLCINAVGSQMAAAGQVRAMMIYGWGHFFCYGATVFVVAPFGIVWVAIAAAIVHSVFLLAAYLLVRVGERGSGPWRALVDAVGDIAADAGGATLSSLVLVAVGLVVAHAMSAIHTPAIPHIAAVSLVSLSAYLVALRVLFPQLTRTAVAAVRRLLPRASLPVGMPRARRRVGAA
jgi:O-antigen/teichoic acid export membrane protein